jgi:type I restriction enzyme S subunit
MVDLRPDHLTIAQGILQAEVPAAEVWAFGSRARWTSEETSDLDLAILSNEPLPLAELDRLRGLFEESFLPFSVDVVDWHRIDDEFRPETGSRRPRAWGPEPQDPG